MNERVELQSGEKILLKLRKHWIIFVRDSIGSILLAFLPFIFFSALGLFTPPADFMPYIHFVGLLAGLWLLILWMAVAVIWTNYYLDLWIVTDRRIISVDQVGLFARRVTTLGVDRVQEITVRTSNIFETLFHFGTIEIETASPTDENSKMDGIPHPERARAVIMKQIRGFETLEASNEKQEELLHSISHEVKNYLTKDAAALSSIAEDVAAPAALKTVAGSALSETRKGVDTVMNILDTSNFKNGTVTYESKPYDIRNTIQTVVDEYKPIAEKKGLKLSFAARGALVMNGDEQKISRLVIKNLLDNALHYTATGSVAVSLTRPRKKAVITVSDTGVGITALDMENLFTEGGHGEHSKEMNAASTGYGLFIAKHVVEAHGGTIRAESKGSGEGSRFIVELPLS